MVKTKELSLDLCSKIINLHTNNKFGKKRISKLLNLSISTVRNILTKFNQFGTIKNFLKMDILLKFHQEMLEVLLEWHRMIQN